MTEPAHKRNRITVKYKSANPLFEQWLNEWKKEAMEKGSKLQYIYRTALTSLKKCPIVFNTGQECKILKGFGDHLCKLIDQKLRYHKSQLSEVQDIDNLHKPTKNIQKVSNFKQKHNGKPVSQEMTQLIAPMEFEVSNLETIKEINNINENEFPSFSGTLKDNTNDLEKVGVTYRVNQKKENFTNKFGGNCEPEKIPIFRSTSAETESSNSQQSHTSSSEEEFYVIEPDNFDIILYVDTAETGSDRSDPLLKELSKLSDVCQFEIKKLQIGDYIWICRDRITKNELVLPYIFERKRLDDFASSIKDGRYKEQKYRLKKCGLENKYYLIEEYNRHIGLPITSLQQAAINTAVQDGFRIKTTLNLNHTAKLLNKFSLLLTQLFKGKTLIKCSKENLGPVDLSDDLVSLMSFQEFNLNSVKNKPLNVTDLFIKMLIQIKGMSVQKAMAITKEYQTPLLLKQAIDERGRDVFQNYLSELIYEKQKVGVPLSNTVTQLFTVKHFS